MSQKSIVEMIRRKGYHKGMSNRRYWAQRSKERLSESFATTDEIYEYEKKVYEKSLRDIVKRYKKLISPCMVDGEVDEVLLNIARQDKAFNAEYRHLVASMKAFCKNMGEQLQRTILAGLEKIYKDTVVDICKDFDKQPPLYLLNERAVETAIRQPFTADGREFSDRIWEHLNTMNGNLRKTLAESIVKGEAIDKTVEKFKKIYGNTTYNTSRLIRTETIATYAKSSVESYKAMGVDELEVLEDHSGVCDICSHHNGERIKVNEAIIGVNIPPFHPFCKGCVVPIVEW